jgi:hypothetical protein
VLVAMSASNSSKHANDHQLIWVLSSDDKPSRYLNTIHIAFPKRPPGMHRRRYYRLRGRAADIEAKLLLGRRSAFGSKADIEFGLRDDCF